MGRVRGLFVYDDKGRWLASSEKVNNLASGHLEKIALPSAVCESFA
jgi:hypothetical protein